MRQRSFGNTIKNLLLALLNATLVLLALCLFLGVQLGNRVQDITDSFARNLVSINPLREEIGTMAGELTGLRSDIAALRDGGSEMTTEAAQRISARLDGLETRLDTAAQRFDAVLNSPEALIDHAIERAAEEVKQGIGALRGCAPSDSLSGAWPELIAPEPTLKG
ncbi:hypothetical protein [Alloyangia pacifica]|uniref:Uncharacterized protein n=1 Tax=Alloyangia pacifica TaxID=311180 RepID=A0A1I6WMC0_9RHOB|nr:hypothetical protein [Alloyangia pacifica]SDI93639.1 hypothetical protein SAMN04488245_13217 [Alloyangia pacifica]SFT27173.1 hypothetical protein SAMN04488050_12817 [Alloyangia pacifica]